MSIQEALEKLFEGWRPSISREDGGLQVAVPRMSEGAMRVMRSDIQARLPEVYHLAALPTPEGGYVFHLSVELALPDNLSQFLLAVRSQSLLDLEPQLGNLEGCEDALRAPLVADLAVALDECKEFDLARRGYRLALWLDPNVTKVKFNYGTLLLKLGEIASAVKAYEEILEREPTFEPALHNLVAYHAQRGDDAGTKEYLERLLFAHSESGSAQVLSGQVAQQEGQIGIALEHYLKAIRCDPDTAEPYFRAAVVFRELEMANEAIDHWNRYRERAGRVPEGRYLSARVLLQGSPEGVDAFIDGVPMGKTPKAMMDLPPGSHTLVVRYLQGELALSLTLAPACNYLVRYDLGLGRMTYESTPVDMTLKDENGRELTGVELGQRILERMNVRTPLAGPSSPLGRFVPIEAPESIGLAPATPSGLPSSLVAGGLTSRAVFACVLFECLKDRELSDSERDLIFAVKQLLKISAEVHQQVFREVEERLRTTARGGEEAQPEQIYRLLAQRALEDGYMLTEENQLLTQIGRLLAIPRPRRQEIEKEVSSTVQPPLN